MLFCWLHFLCFPRVARGLESCGHVPPTASHHCHSPKSKKTPRRGPGFKRGTLRGLPHARGQRTGERKGQSTQHPSPIPGSVSSGDQLGGLSSASVARAAAAPPRGGRRGDWGTRKLASAPLSCHLELGDTPIHPTLSPSPVAVAPHVPLVRKGLQERLTSREALANHSYPLSSPGGFPGHILDPE